MTICAWVGLDDELVPADEAMLSVFDAGLLHGAGLFETLRIARGRPVDLERHLERLVSSASHLGIAIPPVSRLHERTVRWLERAAVKDGRLRLTVTAGSVAGHSPFDPSGPRTILFGESWPEGQDPRVASARARTVPFEGGACAGHKTLAYLPWWLARRSAGDADEAILIDRAGHVLEGATSNVFALIDGEIRTPPEDGLLPGITRRRVLELARGAGSAVHLAQLTKEELRRAEEIFLTRSTTGVLPVVELDGSAVGSGRPGARTLRLHRLYEDWVAGLEGRPR